MLHPCGDVKEKVLHPCGDDIEKPRKSATKILYTFKDERACDKVVVAMGPWSCQLEDWLGDGTSVPMTGIKSTSIVYDHSAARQKVKAEPYALFCGEDGNGCHLEVYPRPDGSVYLCGIGGSDHVEGGLVRARVCVRAACLVRMYIVRVMTCASQTNDGEDSTLCAPINAEVSRKICMTSRCIG